MSTVSNIRVYSEETPNPASLKFIVNKLLVNGSADFPNREAAQSSPLVKKLFDEFSFVTSVFVASNFVTVSKNDSVQWDEEQLMVKNFIQTAIESGLTIKEDGKDSLEFEGTDVEKKIQQILRDYVQPAVESDGGAISYKAFDEGVVSVVLRGSCSGCPSASLTLKAGIESLLTRMVPEVKEVIAVPE